MSACPETRESGFESTHPGRIGKLPGIVVIAFAWAYLIGDRPDEKKPPAIRNHGYRAKSIFKYGSDYPWHIFPDMIDHAEKLSGISQFLSPKYFLGSILRKN